jgi:hypothetical protein
LRWSKKTLVHLAQSVGHIYMVICIPFPNPNQDGSLTKYNVVPPSLPLSPKSIVIVPRSLATTTPFLHTSDDHAGKAPIDSLFHGRLPTRSHRHCTFIQIHRHRYTVDATPFLGQSEWHMLVLVTLLGVLFIRKGRSL